MSILFLLLVIVVAGVLYLRYRLHHTSDNGDLAAAIDKEAHKFTRKAHPHALVIGVYKNGKAFTQGYGTISADNPASPDATAIFQIGSVSKVLTAITLQVLCDESVLSLDTTLESVLGDTYPLDAKVKPITLRQLATHTSGFPCAPKPLMEKLISAVGKDSLMENPYSHLDVAEIMAYLQHPQGLRKPGKFAYSNYGMGLLGHILEKVTGKPLNALVQEKLLHPLTMPDTAIAFTVERQQRLVQGHDAKGKSAGVWTFTTLGGAGAFLSSVIDMLQFIRANLDDKHPLAATLKRTHQRQDNGKTGVGWMQATLIDRFIGNRHVIWHDGQVGGYAAYLAIDPLTKTGVVVLSAQSVGIDMLGVMLMRQVRTQSWKS